MVMAMSKQVYIAVIGESFLVIVSSGLHAFLVLCR